MSRSYRKTPIMGLAGDSDKWYKIKLHRQRRRQWRQLLIKGNIDDLDLEKPFDSWDSDKDGKTEFFRYKITDPARYKKLMRK